MEFSIYDCHSCHQGMKPRRGRPEDFSSDLPAGGLRLMDHSFDMVAVVLEVIAPERFPAYEQSVRSLHRSHNSADGIAEALAALDLHLRAISEMVAGKAPAPQIISQIRREIARYSARGRFADYGSAEQAFLALEALSFALEDRARLKSALDKIYASLEDETSYEPAAFASASRQFLNAL